MGRKQTIYIIYILNFLLALSVGIPAYVNSIFLKEYAPEKFVGLIFIAGSVLSLIAFANIPRVLRVFSNFNIIITLLVLQIILLLILSAASTLSVIIPIFILYWTAIPLISFSLDLFLEAKSTDETTGKTRGVFLTAANIAWVIAPAIAGFILTNGDYWKIYIASSLFTLPVLYLACTKLKKIKEPVYDKVPFWGTLREIYNRKNVYKIFMANILLRFFYSWMVIYTPIYLRENIGFTWNELGIMFTIMLLPFILLELPIGRLADTKFGEKEFLTLGFIIMFVTVSILPFITSTSFWVWAIALFATRIGASMVEITTETYFFKKIDGTDAHILSIFRNNRSIAWIAGPLVASVFLFFFDLKYLFLALGIIMLLGLKYSLTIKDTK